MNYIGIYVTEQGMVHWSDSTSGGKLKESGTTHWSSPNTGATDEVGFTALPGGACYYGDIEIGDSFYGMGKAGYWWGKDPYYYYFHLNYNIRSCSLMTVQKEFYNCISVRCIKH
jgi:uncharacterized protein (TIGR02145 family)